jgi:hypothetical protein
MKLSHEGYIADESAPTTAPAYGGGVAPATMEFSQEGLIVDASAPTVMIVALWSLRSHSSRRVRCIRSVSE